MAEMDDVMMPAMPAPPDHQSASRMSMEPEVEAEAPEAGEVESVNIRPAANGGFIASCMRRDVEHKGGGYDPQKDYAFPNIEALVEWVRGELA